MEGSRRGGVSVRGTEAARRGILLPAMLLLIVAITLIAHGALVLSASASTAAYTSLTQFAQVFNTDFLGLLFSPLNADDQIRVVADGMEAHTRSGAEAQRPLFTLTLAGAQVSDAPPVARRHRAALSPAISFRMA